MRTKLVLILVLLATGPALASDKDKCATKAELEALREELRQTKYNSFECPKESTSAGKTHRFPSSNGDHQMKNSTFPRNLSGNVSHVQNRAGFSSQAHIAKAGNLGQILLVESLAGLARTDRKSQRTIVEGVPILKILVFLLAWIKSKRLQIFVANVFFWVPFKIEPTIRLIKELMQ